MFVGVFIILMTGDSCWAEFKVTEKRENSTSDTTKILHNVAPYSL
jgi:hypothetical protein